MSLRQVTASLALAAMVVGAPAVPALAHEGVGSGAPGKRVNTKFEDMVGFEWGLNQVVKMQVKGIFEGRANRIFAPGAKINRQEAAVVITRLLNREAETKALSSSDVDALLKSIPDQAEIDAWARASVATLVRMGAVSQSQPFYAREDATRLDVAVILVKALGFGDEAAKKMNVRLAFKDAHAIPSDLVGYIATAVDHKLIAGYDDRTFKPEKAVKRVEMAVMMGRADRQVQREKADEVKGTVKSVDAAAHSLTITSRGRDLTLGLAEDASIFVDNVAKDLVNVMVNMKIEVKLNSDGKIVYLEAMHRDDDEAVVVVPQSVTGSITALVPASQTSAAKLSLSVSANGVTTVTEYTLDVAATVLINGAAAQFTDLKTGDSAKLTVTAGVTMVEATRTVQETIINGMIGALTASAGSGDTATPARITIGYVANGSFTMATYNVLSMTKIYVNGQAAQFSDLRAGNSAKLTLVDGVLTKIEVTR